MVDVEEQTEDIEILFQRSFYTDPWRSAIIYGVLKAQDKFLFMTNDSDMTNIKVGENDRYLEEALSKESISNTKLSNCRLKQRRRSFSTSDLPCYSPVCRRKNDNDNKNSELSDNNTTKSNKKEDSASQNGRFFLGKVDKKRILKPTNSFSEIQLSRCPNQSAQQPNDNLHSIYRRHSIICKCENPSLRRILEYIMQNELIVRAKTENNRRLAICEQSQIDRTLIQLILKKYRLEKTLTQFSL